MKKGEEIIKILGILAERRQGQTNARVEVVSQRGRIAVKEPCLTAARGMSSQKNDSIVDSVFHYKKGFFIADSDAIPKRLPVHMLLSDQQNEVHASSIFPPSYPGESVDAVKARHEAFSVCRNSLDTLEKSLAMELNLKAFTTVSKFFHKSYSDDGCSAKWRSREAVMPTKVRDTKQQAPSPGSIAAPPTKRNPRDRFLPTAIVCAGLNLSDHDKTFDGMKKYLMRTCTPHVVSIFARDCESTTNAKKNLSDLLIKNLCNTLSSSFSANNGDKTSDGSIVMSNGGIVDYDDSKRNTRDSTQAVTTAIDAALDAETRAKEEKRFGRKVKGGQKTLTPLGDVEEWYKHFYVEGATNSNSSNSKVCPPMIVCIEDFDFFKPGILQDMLITLTRAHRRGVPVGIILGVASVTGPDAVHARLPRPVTNLLWMRTIRLENSMKTMDNVIDKLFVSCDLANFPLRLSYKVLRWMSDRFLEYTFSVSSCIRSLQFAAMEHYYTNRLSSLSVDLGSSIGTDEVMNRAMKIVENLGASDVQYLMSLKSIKMGQTLSSEMPSKTNITSTSTITNMTKSEAALLKNQKLKIATWLADIHVYKRVYGFVFHAAYDTLKYVTTHVAPDRNSNPTSQGGYSNQVPGVRRVYLDSLESTGYWYNFVRKVNAILQRSCTVDHLVNIVSVWEKMFDKLDQTFPGRKKGTSDGFCGDLDEEESMLSNLKMKLKEVVEASVESLEQQSKTTSNSSVSSTSADVGVDDCSSLVPYEGENRNSDIFPSASRKGMNFAKKRKLAFSSIRKRSKQKIGAAGDSGNLGDDVTKGLEVVSKLLYKFLDGMVKKGCAISAHFLSMNFFF